PRAFDVVRRLAPLLRQSAHAHVADAVTGGLALGAAVAEDVVLGQLLLRVEPPVAVAVVALQVARHAQLERTERSGRLEVTGREVEALDRRRSIRQAV